MSGGALLAAMQLGDSMFPSGGFTLSHGLETLAEHKVVRTATELREWLATTLAWQVGPSDGVATAAAWNAVGEFAAPDRASGDAATVVRAARNGAADGLVPTVPVADHVAAGDFATVYEIDVLLHATKLAREPREASVRTGRQLLDTLWALVGDPFGRIRADVRAGRSPGSYATVLGVAGRRLGLGRHETVLLLLHLHVAGCIGAALRLLDVDDVEVQRVRLELVPDLCAAADAALALPWKEVYACVPQTELMTMLHERATMRLFAT